MRVSSFFAILILALPPVWGASNFELANSVRQGHALRIRIGGVERGEGWSAQWGEKRFRLFKQADGHLLGFVPVPATQPPGPIEITVREGEAVRHTVTVEVTDAKYQVRNLRVSTSTTGLQASPGEIERTNELLATVTEERLWQEPFAAPTPHCINSPFGVQTHVNGKATGAYHRGTDLLSPTGTPVRATAAGVVKIAQKWNMQGGMIGIDHGQGVVSTYLHLSKLAAEEGQSVQRGDIVGYVGATGFVTGPHLHFGIGVNGTFISAASWVPALRSCAAAGPVRPAASPRKSAAVKKKR